MKYIKLIVIFISIILSACHKDFQFKDIEYSTYNRVVGPEGGTINYYANYDNDTKTEVIASMEVPSGALDSLLVFNMYQFEDYELAGQMEEGFAKFGSKILYFVPFYESEGYHERGPLELNYHLSIDFKDTVMVTYYPLADYSDLAAKNWQEVELYHTYYKTTNRAYKVYRIKIPKIDEWGESNNIFVNWNRQGYANGYDRTDLTYIVNGRWSAISQWGTGTISLENWELVGNYVLDTDQDFIRFAMNSTDYLYLIARDILVTNYPPAITGHISLTYPAAQILRVSFDDNEFKAYLSDNSVVTFSRFGDFISRTIDNQLFNNLPTNASGIISSYLNANFNGEKIKKITEKQSLNSIEYQFLMESGVRLFFNETGGFIGSFQYNFNPDLVPQSVFTYIHDKFPGAAITNISSDFIYTYSYIVYLDSNIKVYFDSDGIWSYTLYYRVNNSKLPDVVKQYFANNFPNAIFSEINITIWPTWTEISVFLVDNKTFTFNGQGELQSFEFRNLSINDLPQNVKENISKNAPDKVITNIFHIYTDRTEFYRVFFTDYSELYVNANVVN